ncbi:hypothetical protein DNTS_012363 [Danionella cerebrum]|uniref:Uncharacterized protein n=1 Tax=Danionella cerebrum TaxID=2873325 RepID=A0A553R8H3_9TELE|nr:hypothetical protein DNTS_012363 [Danionella translucida]
MSERHGHYTELSQRAIENSTFQDVTLIDGKATDKLLKSREFFLSLAKNLGDRLLSQGGRVPDKTSYNDFIDELKVLYAQYWPEDMNVMYGQTEIESLCERFNLQDPRAVIRAYRTYKDSNGKIIPDKLKELFAAVNTIPISKLPIPSTQLDPAALTLKFTEASMPQQQEPNEPDWGRGC